MSRGLWALGCAALRASLLVKNVKLPVTLCSAVPRIYSGIRLSSSKSQGAAKLKEKIMENNPGKRVLNYNELCALMSRGDALLIDVRDANEFSESGHITGAVNIPLTELKVALKMTEEEFQGKYGLKKPKPSDDNIVFYGLSDVLSAAASEIAHNLGYKKSKCYPEGWTGWCAMHNPEESQ
ncbi:Heat shock protein 67B2 [Fasciola gigantica]|uniref:Heat shock protein 67B2 n=1 Tax=Fasciola gigantica TaxID=46835 RepID=A0A504WSJ7_FASGI|nr:Heat shock protein 67B2 [Fasciola gigantica]